MASKPLKGRGTEEGEPWHHSSWHDYCRGKRNISELAKKYGVRWNTMKANIVRMAERARVAVESGAVDALGEYVSGLEADLEYAHDIMHHARNDSARVGALKHIADLREKLAAARGVVTKRQATEVSGPAGKPVEVAHEIGAGAAADILGVLAECGALAAGFGAPSGSDATDGDGPQVLPP